MSDKKNILIIEDEAVTARIEAAFLEHKGYNIILAASGEEAVKLVQSEKTIDLVLVDVDLGAGMDGPETAETILSIHTVPLMFLSNLCEEVVIRKTEKIRHYGYVEKSSGNTVLLASIKMAFRLFDAQQELLARERKLAETLEAYQASEGKLREIEEIFNLFLKYSPVYVFFKDAEIRSLYLSQNYEQMLGKPLDDLLGKSMYDLFPSELARSMVNDDKKILESGEPYEVVETFDDRVYTTTKFPIIRENKPPYLAGFTMDITDLKKAEESLSKTIMEKNALLGELQHRVKNSFNIILNLIDLEAQRIPDESCKPLWKIRDRIRSMVSLYDLLVGSSEFQEVRLDQYINNLSRSLQNSYVIDNNIVNLKTELSEITINVKKAVPVGIILNELLTNSFKYAFPENRKGSVEISLSENDEMIFITVADDGVGIPDEFIQGERKGLGLTIIDVLIEQLNGTLNVSNDKGTSFQIRFVR